MIALMIDIASGTNALKAMVETYSHASLKTSHTASKRTEVSTQEHAAMMKIRSSSVYQTSRKTRETKILSRLASFKTTKRTAPVTSSASGKVKRPNATTLLDGLPVELDSHAQCLLKDTARMEKSKKSSSSLLDLKSTIQLITAVNVVRRSTNQKPDQSPLLTQPSFTLLAWPMKLIKATGELLSTAKISVTIMMSATTTMEITANRDAVKETRRSRLLLMNHSRVLWLKKMEVTMPCHLEESSRKSLILLTKTAVLEASIFTATRRANSH